MFHKRVTKRTFNFVMDKVRCKLDNWNAKLLSLVRRITLARFVLLSISNYFTRTVKIPLGVYDEIEKIAWAFIWDSTTSNKKVPLVNWMDCCQSLMVGFVTTHF